jgi:Spy/CpxP family protein refolding chaperone
VVSRWKVLLVAFVIFAAGAATGAMVVHTYAPRILYRTHVTPPVQMSTEHRMEYVKKLDRELQLTPEQRQKVEAIIAASQERMKKIWEVVEPQVKEEYGCSRRDISEILTPEQREKMKQRWHRNGSRNNGNGTNTSVGVSVSTNAPTTR